jgi:hypothetical protein
LQIAADKVAAAVNCVKDFDGKRIVLLQSVDYPQCQSARAYASRAVADEQLIAVLHRRPRRAEFNSDGHAVNAI